MTQNSLHPVARRPYADYELETIRAIRKLGSRLNNLTRDRIRELYSEWSGETACAGWLPHSEGSLKCFVEWATIAPCDRQPNDEARHPAP